MEVFLKRAENPFKEKIGAEKTRKIFDDLKNALHLIPGEYSGSLGPEIPRLLFKYSQGLDEIPNEIIEGILHHFLLFTNSLHSQFITSLKRRCFLEQSW